MTNQRIPVNVTDHDDKETFYHVGAKRRRKDTALSERPIIAWDGEGMQLSGRDKPQHYVVFGCSADIEGVLVGRDLHYLELLRYIVSIGQAYPNAVHIGYGFRYDMNMIIRHMPLRCLTELRENNETYINDGSFRFRVAWLPGKRFIVTRTNRTGPQERTTVQIDDIASFFGTSFINATESILGDDLSEYERAVIAHGKLERGSNLWDDLPDVLEYWRAEIQLMQKLGEKFRGIMYEQGFMLTSWYGPGALSSYLLRTRKLATHIVNGPPDLPTGVHTAAKHAYAGGRFEMFRFGRFKGPIYGIDINSAYPFAMSKAPSLGEDHGFWQHVEAPTRIDYFGVYRIRFRAMETSAVESAAMPLFHRDFHGSISYPTFSHGWYWSPEANLVMGSPDAEIVEGWVWVNDGNRPFIFLAEMYLERQRIGKENVASMPFKLGPNSMYGKFAQRVGHRDGKPPKSFCLPLAGWVTSYCRSMLYGVMQRIPPSDLIAVETDGLYTTFDINQLDVQLSDKLGDWDYSVYDEMLYVQSGVYHRRRGNEWLGAKSRGLDAASVSLSRVSSYLESCHAGEFPSLSVDMRDRFVGLTAAMAGSAPVKVRHCRWEGGSRELVPGGTGKRAHVPAACAACSVGATAWEQPHTLVIRTRATGEISAPHHLPWEAGTTAGMDTVRLRELDEIDRDMTNA